MTHTVSAQDFKLLSSHEGKIDQVLVTMQYSHIQRVLSDPTCDAFILTRNLLCAFNNAGIGNCLVFKKQIHICSPVTERAGFMTELRNLKGVSLVGSFDELGVLDSQILHLENKIDTASGFLHKDLNASFKNSDTSNLNSDEVKLLKMVRQWYDQYLVELNNRLKTQLDSVKKEGRDTLCLIPDHSPFSLSWECTGTSYETALEVGGVWTQDEYLSFSNDTSFKTIPILSSNVRNGTLPEIMPDACDLKMDTTIKIDIQGGNVLVSGPFALIGMDVLKKWYSVYEGMDEQDRAAVQKRSAYLGLDTTSASDSITAKLEAVLGRKIIWVGDTTPYWNGYRISNRPSLDLSSLAYGYQPTFHIDLFLCPISYVENGNDTIMSILVGVPDEKWQCHEGIMDEQTEERRDLITNLKNRIDSAVTRLKHDLKNQGVTCDTIHVPLPLGFKRSGSAESPYRSIANYFPYCNGLVHNDNGDTIFFSPKWTEQFLNENFVDSTVEDTVTSKLKADGLDRVAIEGIYGDGGALHCKVLVVKRSH